ncbi:MAG: hypothetical protein M1838_004730 [Thelocarpon superellum]|nr:MAG: hypothetical protein M1838_004730 [Thelocarpon superellum]
MVPTSSSSASRTGAHNNKSPRYDPDPSRYGGSSSAYGVPPASSTASTFRQSSNAPNSSYTNGPSAVGSMFGVGALTSRSMTAGSSTRPNAYGAMTIAPAGPSSSRYAAPAPAPDPAAPAPQQSIHIHIHAQEPAAAPAPAPAPTPVPRVAQPREDAYHPRYGSRTRYVPVPVAVYDPFYDPFMHDRCLDPFCHYC